MIPVARAFRHQDTTNGNNQGSRIRRLNHPRVRLQQHVERYHQLLAADEQEENTTNSEEFESDHSNHSESTQHKQDWTKVDSVAYVIILTTAFECFLEGIAFTLTLQDDIVAGFTVLFAMILKLIPQKLGNAIILMQSGLNHFWENVLALAAVSSIYVGKDTYICVP